MRHKKSLIKQVKAGRPVAEIQDKLRIGFDVSKYHKQFIKKAALMRNVTIVAFITDSVVRSAERVLNQNFAEFYKSETEKKAIMQPFNNEDDDV